VCLEESLYVHNIRDMKVLHTIRDTPPNPTGICCLSANNDNCYLAYPGSNQSGGVEIFDTVNLVCYLHSLFVYFSFSEFSVSFMEWTVSHNDCLNGSMLIMNMIIIVIICHNCHVR